MAANLQIHLLGGLQIVLDGVHQTRFVSSKVPALLAYLAVSGRTHQRDALAGLLWGEMPDAAAANNLRQALTNLRKLAKPHLLITRDTVAFNRAAPYLLDVESFQEGLRLGSEQSAQQRADLLRQALALYQGDFLAGFHVRDAPDFEDWALVQRVHLRELALQGWDMLARLLLETGDYAGALDASGHLVAMDAWREEGHRYRMIALARSGQRSAALAQYQTCRKVLRQEFDVEPSAETTALYDRIRAAMRGPHHNLPRPTTGFVGRDREQAELRVLLASHDTRLLAILGPGGVGKTRLALELAAACEAMFLNGVWLVSLAVADPGNPHALALAIAQALQIPLTTPGDPTGPVLDFMCSRELLLILDNMDVLAGRSAWLSHLLAKAPDLKILVTSRERLDLQAERIFHLAGLATPQPEAENAEAFPAVQLFLRRARRLQADFSAPPEDLADIARICHMLQGLPLGIELAAAWTQQLNCQEIVAQLEGNMDFLSTTRRDVSPRQRSLRAVFDGSWSRLSPAEQLVFTYLAVFQGPFSRQAAEQVASTSFVVLSTLADKSLVWRRGRILQLHEVTRHFAYEKLTVTGTERDARDRHAGYYADLLGRNKARLEGRDQKTTLEELEREIDNVRAAWQWLVDQRDSAGIDAATDGLYPLLMIRSRFREGLEAFRSARLALEEHGLADHKTRVIASRVKAREGRFLASLAQHDEALTLLAEALAALRSLDVPNEIAFVLGHMGGIARARGELVVAEERLQECLALRQATGTLYGQAVAWLELAGTAFMRGDYDTCRLRCVEGLGIAERVGDLQTMAHLLTGLSLSHRELGDYGQAQAFGQRSLAIYEELEDSYGLLQAFLTLGELSRRLGDHQEAHRLCERAVLLAQQIGDLSGEADGHYRLGQIAANLGRRDKALDRLRQALDLATQIGETPLVLDILLEIGCLMVEEDPGRAAAILGFLSGRADLPAERQARVRHELAKLSGASPHAMPQALEEVIGLAR